MARIVFDTDVVSLYRAGRLPPGVARQVVTNDISIAFATAGELWKGALAKRWGVTRRGGLDLWLAKRRSFPPALPWRRSGAGSPPAPSNASGHGR